jgi:hypothetical protein
VIRVRSSVVSTLGTDLSESLQEEAYSSDPDLNPPLSVTEEQLLPTSETVTEAEPVVEEPAVEIAQAVEPQAEAPAEAVEEAAVVEEQPAEAAEEAAAEPEAKEPTPEEKRLQEVADRVPQKQLYMPPRQQEVYALAPEPAPAEEVAEVVEEPPVEEVTEPEISEEEAPPAEEIEPVEEGPPRVSMLGPEAEEEPLDVALPGPEAAEPEKPSPEGTRLPAPEEETPLTMVPEEPPTSEFEEAGAEEVVEAFEPVGEIAMAEAAPGEAMVLSETLPSQTYFVQLGAYSTRNLAEKLAGDLTRNYSVTILPASAGDRRFYKVLVGPLNVDESGTLLYQFRSRGFKDAFIQYVE